MFIKNSILVMGISIATIILTTAQPTTNVVLAAIICSGSNPCQGTDNNDNMVGDTRGNQISGRDGNDVIIGKAGNDLICGGAGDDFVNGGEGDDPFLVGDFFPGPEVCEGGSNIAGVDKIFGGNGDDRLFHSSAFPPGTSSDGNKDILDCGPGNVNYRNPRQERI